MKIRRSSPVFLMFLTAISLAFPLRGAGAAAPECPSSFLKPGQKLITILGTNDIHGAIEPTKLKDGKTVGGLAFWAGVVQSIKNGIQNQFGACGGTVLLDGGDQFQGTLMSNFTEGDVMFKAFNEIGYDAVVPGNHDYDFGPLGWLEDKVTRESVDQNPRGVIEKLAQQAHFPLLSANTYLKESIVDFDGRAIEVESVGCKTNALVDWNKAFSPLFLRPYLIKEVAGIRVAIIGLDNPATPKTTTLENVSDLCFRDPFDTYVQVREGLEGRADVFILVMHEGDSINEFNMSNLITRLTKLSPRMVDAVVGGHTHFTNLVQINGVPGIQSGSGGERFGRIDLVYDTETRSVIHDPARAYAGLLLHHSGCDKKANFCEALAYGIPEAKTPQVAYEKYPVTHNKALIDLIAGFKTILDPLATRVLGIAHKDLTRDRIGESAIANAMTDGLRRATGAEISFLNTGGLRENIPAGLVTYEKLFQVIPFGNRVVMMEPMNVPQIIGLLQKSIETCGSYGALLQSGLRVTFTRDCKAGALDPNAKLLTVKTVSGETVYDATVDPIVISDRNFEVATLDFLAAGGSGYAIFAQTPVKRDFGIFRELLTEELISRPACWSGELDGRWQLIRKN